MRRLLFIPPDTRPQTLTLPLQLARMVGAEVKTPPCAALPSFWRAGDAASLRLWLLSEAAQADTLVVCLETLTLGGMIPARRGSEALSTVLERLEVLVELKRRNPQLKILAFGVVVRVAHDNDPHEEKPYYGEWGAQLRAYSVAADRLARYGAREQGALAAALAAVPPEILSDWLSTRERNHQLHLAALALVRSGVIEHLCLTLDDTSEYGLAALNRRALEQRTDEWHLWKQVDIYPGADEVPCVLLARTLQPQLQRAWVVYSSLNGAQSELIYEDRSAGELLRAQLRAAGCVLAGSAQEADFTLFVNTPGKKQANVQPSYASVDTPERHLPAFIDQLEAELSGATPVVLADIAYPNGAEQRLWHLLQPLPLSKLAGYTAWNTAGNTLGTAAAFGKLAGLVSDAARRTEAVFGRMVDDALYQALVRPQLRAALGHPNPYDLREQRRGAEQLLEQLMAPRIAQLWNEHFAENDLNLETGLATLAWPRLFTGVFPLQVTQRRPGAKSP